MRHYQRYQFLFLKIRIFAWLKCKIFHMFFFVRKVLSHSPHIYRDFHLKVWLLQVFASTAVNAFEIGRRQAENSAFAILNSMEFIFWMWIKTLKLIPFYACAYALVHTSRICHALLLTNTKQCLHFSVSWIVDFCSRYTC